MDCKSRAGAPFHVRGKNTGLDRHGESGQVLRSSVRRGRARRRADPRTMPISEKIWNDSLPLDGEREQLIRFKRIVLRIRRPIEILYRQSTERRHNSCWLIYWL